MAVKQVVPGLHKVTVKGVNVFLIDRDGVTLVDTGMPGGHELVLGAVRQIGREPSDVKNILISHYHWDHVGNLRELKEATGAKVLAASGDADVLRRGGAVPPMTTRGVLGTAIKKTAARFDPLPAMPIDEDIEDGRELPIGRGLQVVGTPGHTPGHVCFLWQEHGGVLFTTDGAFNVVRKLQAPPLSENLGESDKSFVKLSELEFEIAAFAHGPTITTNAAQKFRKVAKKYR